MPQHSITSIDDAKIIACIDQAQRRIVYLAPGVSQSIAEALEDAWKRLGPEAVTVILDVDPEVCRLGYGTIEGLQSLKVACQRYGAVVCQQPGARIGLLIVDDMTFIYTPTPLLIEAGSTQPEHPNAIQLSQVPATLAKDVGLGERPNLERTIGLDTVAGSQVDEVAADLKNNPPVKFDLARKVRVFSSIFQFVEFEMTGCYLSKKKVSIPSDLLGLTKDTEPRRKLHASFELIGDKDLKVKANGLEITEESLRKHKTDIIKKFLIPLKGYGSVVLKVNKKELKDAVTKLREEVATFQQELKKGLRTCIEINSNTLVKALLPSIQQNPPDKYIKFYGPKPQKGQVEKLLRADIQATFGTAESLVQEMKIGLVFKEVAYESLVDRQFLEVASKAMHVPFLHEEYEAAKASEGLGSQE